MYNYRRIILFLNNIGINNLRILNFISEGLLDYFFDLNSKNIDRLFFLTENEKLILKEKIDKTNIDNIIHEMSKINVKYSTIIDNNYPKILKEIYNAPVILYYRGKGFDRLDKCLAIVGTRKPTTYGLWATENIISNLSRYNLSIVSGMALGIDAKAHRVAIENNLHTIGVLASSLDIYYPKTNAYLYKMMEDNLLISEFPLNTNPIKRNFVFRNRIISGLSFGTLVIEAASESGSLITAKYALEQNREIFAIPGKINEVYSQGCNDLINKGAKLVQSIEDILEEVRFLEEKKLIKIDISKEIADEKSMAVINELRNKILSIDDISNLTGINIEELYMILIKLELNDYVINIKDNIYSLK